MNTEHIYRVSIWGLMFPAFLSVVLTVTRANAQHKLEDRFQQLDKNKDGSLTPSELPDSDLFKRLDLNSNGEITKTEATRAVSQGALKPEVSRTSRQEIEPTESDAPPVREGPQRIKPGESGVGRQIPDLTFTDIADKQHKVSDYRKQKAVVIAMTGTGCPLCLKYAPTLANIAKQYRDRGITFIFVNPNESESGQELHDAVKTHQFVGPYVSDSKKQLTHALQAKTTTEVFVLDKARTLIYRGAVDDQYGFAYALDTPRVNFLTDTLDAVLAGRSPAVQATSSPGCELYYKNNDQAFKQSTVTYHNRVSRIIQAHCIECHRRGGIAPIPLETYKEVKDYAGMIRRVVERKIMPPWFAAPLPQQKKAELSTMHWANDRSLASQEQKELLTWIKAGVPEGNPKDAPIPKPFPGGWLIGEPDAVFEFSRPVPVKATGIMPYKNVTVETNLSTDKWVQAIEVRPGKIDVVHHVIVSVRRDDGKVDERDGYWGVYVPGNSTLIYPPGYAKLLPKGAKLRFQMHYTPNGTATEDSTRIGLVFAKKPPQHEVKVVGIANSRISIPPGAENHQETARLRLPYDVKILGFLPHMHLRGKAARYELQTANGTEMLLDIPRYDFNWQLVYRLAKPQTFRKGDTIRFTCWFDNSDKNPANPDPTKNVRWGPQTEDEMHLGYIEYIVPGAKPGEPIARMRPAREAGTQRNRLFNRVDANQDGFISREEVRKRFPGNTNAAGPIFNRLDQDNNGKLDKSEFSKLRQRRP